MGTTDRENIIRKVKKLYALAGGSPSPEEAESAVLMAQALLQEHNLALSEADFLEENASGCVEHREETGTRHHSGWVVLLGNTIARAFDCKTLYGASYCCAKNRTIPHVRFVGVEPDVSLARHSFVYLCGVARRYRDARKSTAQINHWRIGFAEAVGGRLIDAAERNKAASPQVSALVLRKDDLVAQHMAAKYPEIKTTKCRPLSLDAKAYLEGRIAGKNVSLAQPLEEGSTSPATALPA